MKNINSIIAILLLSTASLIGQESVNSSGGSAAGTGGDVSYSVGQVTYSYYSTGSGSISQGVQQTYEISQTSGTNEIAKELELSIYPNPTSDYLELKIGIIEITRMEYRLIDSKGTLIDSKELVESETKFDFNHLTPSTYFLQVSQNNELIKTFKIVKN